MGCSEGLAKTFLFIFNAIFFLFGLTVMVAGSVVLALPNEQLLKFINIATQSASETDKASVESYFSSMNTVQVAAIIFIVVGIITLVIGFCGCCGAIKHSVCLLYTYAIFVGIIFLIEVSIAIVVAVYKDRAINTASNSAFKLMNKYYIPYDTYKTGKNSSTVEGQLTLAVNAVQVLFSCCGINETNDLANSLEGKWRTSSPKYNNQAMTTPMACCPLKMDNNEFFKNDRWKEFFDNPSSFLKDDTCPTAMIYRGYESACVPKIVQEINKYSTILIGVAAGIGVFELLGILFACCLIRAKD